MGAGYGLQVGCACTGVVGDRSAAGWYRDCLDVAAVRQGVPVGRVAPVAAAGGGPGGKGADSNGGDLGAAGKGIIAGQAGAVTQGESTQGYGFILPDIFVGNGAGAGQCKCFTVHQAA